MDELYRLFDRRCRTETALTKLAQLRQRVQRFTRVSQLWKGLFSANLDKALTFLDDRWLGATSNAVERGNRRYRKMQKTIYRVRTYAHVVARLALDLFREASAHSRSSTLQRLHLGRAGPARDDTGKGATVFSTVIKPGPFTTNQVNGMARTLRECDNESRKNGRAS